MSGGRVVPESVADANGSPGFYLSSSHTARRFFVHSGAPPSPAFPTAGADVDGVARAQGDSALPSYPGVAFKVEAGASFSAGASLHTDGSGRAVTSGTTVVARSLESSSGAGDVVWAVWASGR